MYQIWLRTCCSISAHGESDSPCGRAHCSGGLHHGCANDVLSQRRLMPRYARASIADSSVEPSVVFAHFAHRLRADSMCKHWILRYRCGLAHAEMSNGERHTRSLFQNVALRAKRLWIQLQFNFALQGCAISALAYTHQSGQVTDAQEYLDAQVWQFERFLC